MKRMCISLSIVSEHASIQEWQVTDAYDSRLDSRSLREIAWSQCREMYQPSRRIFELS